MKKMLNQHIKVYFGSIRVFREFWKSTVTFSCQNDTGHYLEIGLHNSVRRFRKTFSNPDKFVGEPPHLEAQPPLTVAK
jgi:hypothetical protein